jgi:iron complex transport system substrate-binding protein
MPCRPSRPDLPRALTALPLTAVLLLAACGGGGTVGGSDVTADEAASSSAPTSSGESYPVTVDNCGFEVTVDAAPQRVVTIKSSTTEMLLALGLGDRVVGAAFLDGPFPDDLADAGGDVPVLSDRAPGPEAVLTVEPDMVYAGWESSFSAESAGDRQALADLGVASYVSPSACKGEGYQPDPLTFEHVFGEIDEAGRVFGAADAAADLVDRQRAQLGTVTPDERGLTALWFSSGSDVPYVGAGIGAPQMIMDAVGLDNIAGAVHDTWTSYGWEDVVAADPDVIVLVDAAWNTADKKIGILEANPVTAKLTAVRERRYLVVPFAASEAGVRNVEAVTDLAAQLQDLEVAG